MLTDTAIKALKPKDKLYKIVDRDGMYVVVQPSGSIVFRLDYRLNGRPTEELIPDSVLAELAARYEGPNRHLAQQLDAAGIPRPGWLASSTERSGVAEGE